MTRLHHVNLGVLPGGIEAEGLFLTQCLGYREVEPPASARGRAFWFETDDGTQVHLRVDADHRAAAIAHTALEIGAELDAVAERLRGADIEFEDRRFDDRRTLICADPAGNRWELRG